MVAILVKDVCILMLQWPKQSHLVHLFAMELGDVGLWHLFTKYCHYKPLTKIILNPQDVFPWLFPTQPLQNYKHHIFQSRSKCMQVLRAIWKIIWHGKCNFIDNNTTQDNNKKILTWSHITISTNQESLIGWIGIKDPNCAKIW